MVYPNWSYFPRNEQPPQWAHELVGVVASLQSQLDTEVDPSIADKLDSDGVLQAMRPQMEALGYLVESGKTRAGKIFRPVLFGDNGTAGLTYEIDAFHEDLGIAVEVEAGRGAKGNADYRDIVRMSLLLDGRFMVLLMPMLYRYGTKGAKAQAFSKTRDQFSAIYASQRLRLPFDGVLLIGY
jgi:hypothetical protein